MKLAVRILFSIIIIITTAFYFITDSLIENVRVRYLEGVEESMVDHATLLASIVSNRIENQEFSTDRLEAVFNETYKKEISSKIYRLKKTNVDTRLYITDVNGLIIFDSAGKAKPGEDYSNWRDVYLTLRGKYGARSSRENPDDPNSSVLYVASPLIIHKKIKGVLTLAKPTTNINNFFYIARKEIIFKSLGAGFIIIFLSGAVIIFLTRPINQLKEYADSVRSGKKADLPKLDKTEIGDMGRAFENMRQSLENRKYVETYVQTLTHEIKSPVSAIKGAAELLGEEMPFQQKTIFLGNIKTESERIRMLVDKMLSLSAIENMNSLKDIKRIDLSTLLQKILDSANPVVSGKKIELIRDIEENILIDGEPMLIKQAVSNLIQNSVDFGRQGDTIKVKAFEFNGVAILKIQDQGPGIPDFAQSKIFEKFFSIQRPDSQKKSTGLGLNFVKEIAELHNGKIDIRNNHNSLGVTAEIKIPVST